MAAAQARAVKGLSQLAQTLNPAENKSPAGSGPAGQFIWQVYQHLNAECGLTLSHAEAAVYAHPR